MEEAGRFPTLLPQYMEEFSPILFVCRSEVNTPV
jgi:hypothetical protein